MCIHSVVALNNVWKNTPRFLMGKRKKKRYRGQYCWCCERILPNEKFSGKGHSRHICRECQKLPLSEREYRQAIKNIDRCLHDDGWVRRKKRRAFAQFADHPDPRVRDYVVEIKTRRARDFAIWRESYQEYEERQLSEVGFPPVQGELPFPPDVGDDEIGF